MHLLLRFLAWRDHWAHSFTRLFTYVRAALWLRRLARRRFAERLAEAIEDAQRAEEQGSGEARAWVQAVEAKVDPNAPETLTIFE